MTLVIGVLSIAMTMLLAPFIYLIFKYSIKERTYDDVLEEQRLRYAQMKHDNNKVKSLKINSNTKKKQSNKRKQMKRGVKFAKYNNNDDDNDDIREEVEAEAEPIDVITAQDEQVIEDTSQNNDIDNDVEKATTKSYKQSNVKNGKNKPHLENAGQSENGNTLKHQQNVNITKEKKVLVNEIIETKSNESKNTERNADDISQVVDKRSKDTKKAQFQDSKEEEGFKNSVKEKLTKKKKEVNNRWNGNKVSEKELELIRKNAGGAIDVDMMVSVLNKAELCQSEIQRLIELLLNKQQESSVNDFEWMEGKQDAVNKLKKQLADKEKALSEEQEALISMQNKLKELRNEVNGEKMISKQLEQTLQVKQVEMQHMLHKIQQMTDEQQDLKQQLQKERCRIEALNNEEANLKLSLQQDVNQRQQLELHISLLTEQHQQTIASMRDQITTQIHERDSTLIQLNQHVQDSVLLRERISMLESQLSHMQELAAQLEETRKRANEIEHHFANSQFEITRLTEQLNLMKKDLSNNETECDTLKETLKNMKIENQEVNKENKRLNDKITTDYNDVGQLRKDNVTLTNEIEIYKEKMKNLQTEENNKNIKINELEKEKEIIKEQLNEEKRLHNELTQRMQQQITKLMDEAAVEYNKLMAQCKKNDELRSKNYKAMEAISILENNLENKVKEIHITIQETRKEEQLKIAKKLSEVLSCDAHEITLDDLLDKLNDERRTYLLNDDSISKLKEENGQLKSFVNEYRKIIFDTENTLHSLQKHVEEAESSWARQMAQLKDELNKKSTNNVETNEITMNGNP